jgi:hypothetical protein
MPQPTDQIMRTAAESEVARHFWDQRGVAPGGYIKGMALVYARVCCKLKAGDPAAIEMAKARSGDDARDALDWYDDLFAAEGMRNDTAGVRHTPPFVCAPDRARDARE